MGLRFPNYSLLGHRTSQLDEADAAVTASFDDNVDADGAGVVVDDDDCNRRGGEVDADDVDDAETTLIE